MGETVRLGMSEADVESEVRIAELELSIHEARTAIGATEAELRAAMNRTETRLVKRALDRELEETTGDV